jgi:hypothetical protein
MSPTGNGWQRDIRTLLLAIEDDDGQRLAISAISV